MVNCTIGFIPNPLNTTSCILNYCLNGTINPSNTGCVCNVGFVPNLNFALKSPCGTLFEAVTGTFWWLFCMDLVIMYATYRWYCEDEKPRQKSEKQREYAMMQYYLGMAVFVFAICEHSQLAAHGIRSELGTKTFFWIGFIPLCWSITQYFIRDETKLVMNWDPSMVRMVYCLVTLGVGIIGYVLSMLSEIHSQIHFGLATFTILGLVFVCWFVTTLYNGQVFTIKEKDDKVISKSNETAKKDTAEIGLYVYNGYLFSVDLPLWWVMFLGSVVFAVSMALFVTSMALIWPTDVPTLATEGLFGIAKLLTIHSIAWLVYVA